MSTCELECIRLRDAEIEIERLQRILYRQNREGRYNADEMTSAYFHGDLDLSKLFKKLGKPIVQNILNEI
jgi:hypothetical protein